MYRKLGVPLQKKGFETNQPTELTTSSKGNDMGFEKRFRLILTREFFAEKTAYQHAAKCVTFQTRT